MIDKSGARLKLLRSNLNLTQSGLADAVGYSQGYVSDIESDRSKPSSKFVKTLITLFPNVNGDWLLTGEGEMLKAPPQQMDATVPSELHTISKLGENLAKSSKALIEYLQSRSPFERELDKRAANKMAEEILDTLMENGVYVRPINSAEEIKTLDPDLFEKLHILCAEEHKKHGITLSAPKLTSLTVELFNNISRRVVTMNDKAAVEAMIPVVIKELGERLKEAKDDPGTGKRLA